MVDFSEVRLTGFEGFGMTSNGLLKAVFTTSDGGTIEEDDLFKVGLAMAEQRGTPNEVYLRKAWEATSRDNRGVEQFQWQQRGFAERFRERFTPDVTPAEAARKSDENAKKLGIAMPGILGRN